MHFELSFNKGGNNARGYQKKFYEDLLYSFWCWRYCCIYSFLGIIRVNPKSLKQLNTRILANIRVFIIIIYLLGLTFLLKYAII